MVRFLLSSLFLAVLISAISAQDKRQTEWYLEKVTYTDRRRIFDLKDGCPDGKDFYLDCNSCMCRNKKPAGCTRKGCPEIPQIVNWKEGNYCPAGKTFYWQCRRCRCGASGRDASCTKQACPNPLTNTRQ